MGYDIKNICNVVLLGYFGLGKIIFVECMLYEVGEIFCWGLFIEGNIVFDYINIEKECGNFIFVLFMYVSWKDSKINIVDIFGYDDFVGEVICLFKVVDIGIMFFNVCSGVEVGIELIWEYIECFFMFVFFVINYLDYFKVDYEVIFEQVCVCFGNKVILV